MIETKYQYILLVEETFIEWCIGGTWLYETIFWDLHGPISEELFVTAHQDRYDLICDLYAYNKENDK